MTTEVSTVALDVSLMRHPAGSRGIGRYISALDEVGQRHRVELLPFSIPVGGHPRLEEFRQAVKRPSRITGLGADLFHAPTPLQAPLGPLAVPWVCSVLDLIPLDVRTHRRTGVKMRWFFSRARTADVVLTLSEDAGRRVERHLGVDPARIVCAPLPPAPAFRWRDRALDRSGRGDESWTPYVMALADLRAPDPRKRLPWLSRVARCLGEQGMTLVVVGHDGPERPALGDSPHLRFLGTVPDDRLAGLYAGAACVVVPSAYEGQGLPVLEAMACGTPAVAFANTSLPEVVGDGGRLVSEPVGDPAVAAAGPHSPDDDGAHRLADAVCELVGDGRELERLARAARAAAARFTSERFASAVEHAYRMALT